MINKVSFKNFKAFKEKQTIEIKPITIVFGKNNSGKSAILKLMTLLEGAFNDEIDTFLKLENHQVVSGNEFEDLIYGKFAKALELEVYENTINIDNIVKVKIAVDSSKNLPVLEEWTHTKINKHNGTLYQDKNLFHIENTIFTNKDASIKYDCLFKGLRLVHAKDFEKNQTVIYDMKSYPTLTTDFIGAMRSKAKRDYRLMPHSEKSGIDGSLLYDFLIRDYLTTEKKTFDLVSNWIASNFSGWSLGVDVDNEPYHIHLNSDNLKIDLTEVGMGISQSLPIIIRAFRKCKEEQLIMIEEPEAHLHPSAHAQIMQLLVESVNDDSNKKYLIETHSLNMILRLRRLIAEGKLSNQDVSLYYIDFNLSQSGMREIVLDKSGGVNWWPDGLFSETAIETRAIYNAQLNDLKNVD